MGFDFGLGRSRVGLGNFSGFGGVSDALGLGGNPGSMGVPQVVNLLQQLGQAAGMPMGSGASGLDASGKGGQPQSPVELLQKLKEIAETNPEALKQALKQVPGLAELLQMLLGGASPTQASQASGGGGGGGGGGAPRASGGGGGGGGGGGSKGGVRVDGPNGFLWKPVSDSDGKLAILTPEKLTGQVAGVVVKDANGTVLDRGRPAGVGNGDREHFRFSRPGGAFPPNCTVEIQLKSGETVRVPIADPSARND